MLWALFYQKPAHSQNWSNKFDPTGVMRNFHGLVGAGRVTGGIFYSKLKPRVNISNQALVFIMLEKYHPPPRQTASQTTVFNARNTPVTSLL
jgi:hypothetical protein